MYQSIESRVQAVQANIDLACSGINQSAQSVRVIAVSKLQSTEIIQEAYDSGVRDFGENYAQELHQKVGSCPADIIWHFIGPIQTNKLKLIAEAADWVHSIDRMKVASKLNQACEHLNKKMSVLIQVNIDNEPTKSGVKTEDVLTFAKEINSHCSNLELRGLMFMPNINASNKDKLKTYANIQSLQSSLKEILPNCIELSLGTSGDYEEAIVAGSSMVRIGETLLGPRP
ncbi:YggS family pyridoxal phosphate-dependent enzyme [Gammaproteobacteria bacterium]|nr:YggS family pyridoxal phosphate-dependent enzyme [Gammaproteobacteria bacterium]MDB3856807.1 YggS family pyridoxal phosphate-dependent enzyme [Gammaproteobacteria bacterium]MDC1009018.1 YggS family pyridoxal phosphate-dependent enzyme [Gammaproteobacteria bacterium]MDC1164844.1 YggS family pyridoxal phosphate-dependent enzyme [Gammaproteobacteria bacterium]